MRAIKGESKPRFTVDEQTFVEDFKKLYSKKAKFFSVYDLSGRYGVEDPEVLQLSAKAGNHIISNNFKDFNALKKKNHKYDKCAIIGITDLNNDIKQFKTLLMERPHHEDYDGFILLNKSGIKEKRVNTCKYHKK